MSNMIITDMAQIDNMAEQMCGHVPNLIAIDMNDYNRLKSSSSYLNATQIQMPCFLHEGIEQFKQVVKEFKTEGAHQILLQICGISSSLEVHEIRFKEMCMILKVIEEHFEKNQVAEKLVSHVTSALDKDHCKNVDIVWGLSHHKSAEIDGREVNIIVGYN